MRDIRGDLQDRAGLLEEQINAHEAQFDKLIEQLKREHDARLEDLKAELEAVNRLIEVELRRLGDCARRAEGAGPRARAAPCQPPGAATCRRISPRRHSMSRIGRQLRRQLNPSCRSPISWCAS